MFIAASGRELTKEYMQLVKRIHAHIGGCGQCRALYESYIRADNALDEWLGRTEPTGDGEEFPSEMTVLIHAGENSSGFRFGGVFGTVKDDAFLLKDGGRCLENRTDADVWLRLKDDGLCLRLPDRGGVTADLIGADGSIRFGEPDADGCVRLPLRGAGDCVLQIMRIPEYR